MTGVRTRFRGCLATANGFTLPELLIVMSLSLILLAGAVGVFTANLSSEPRIAERTADVQDARVAMDRLTRELRQGATVISASGSHLSLVTNVNSATCSGAASAEVRSCRVTYTCASGQCSRIQSNPDGSLPTTGENVIDGIASTPVFTYTPSAAAPTYVGVKLEFPASEGDDSITLSDGVTMRNAPAS